MRDGILELEKFRPKVKVENVLHFPEVYRLEGFAQSKPRKRNGVQTLPKLKPLPIGYTFSETEDRDYLKPTWTPLTKMDPAVDYGWLIIRHHPDESHLVGHTNDQIDWFFEESDVCQMSLITDTDYGLFTLTHRSAPPDAPDHLLVHVYTPLENLALPLQERLRAHDCYIIYHPDGSTSHDNQLLYPFIARLIK